MNFLFRVYIVCCIILNYVESSSKGNSRLTRAGFDFNAGSAPSDAPKRKKSYYPPMRMHPKKTESPSALPTKAPTNIPTNIPSDAPSNAPSNAPSDAPSDPPTIEPTYSLTDQPTKEPTDLPQQATSSFPDMIVVAYIAGGFGLISIIFFWICSALRKKSALTTTKSLTKINEGTNQSLYLHKSKHTRRYGEGTLETGETVGV